MDLEEPSGAPRGLLLSLGVVGILVGAGIAAEFVLRIQPPLGGGTAAAGSVIMPVGVGSNTALNFSPSTVTVIIGVNNTLAFINKDSAIHTVTANDGSFNSGDIKAGKSWSNTFSTPGTFTYYCIYHSSWMKGKIIVKSSGGTTTTSGGLLVTIPLGAGSSSALNYSPSTIRLVFGVNNTVTFVNQDSTKHTVTADSGGFNSGDILPNGFWTNTFAVGTYSYHCIYHSYMKGNITVVSS